MDFIAKYEYTVRHKRGKENVVPDFLTILEDDSAPPEELPDEGEIACANLLTEEEEDLQERLFDIKMYLSGLEYKVGDIKARRFVRKAADHHIVWNEKLFRRTKTWLLVVFNQ